jgi:hypothetical protein
MAQLTSFCLITHAEVLHVPSERGGKRRGLPLTVHFLLVLMLLLLHRSHCQTVTVTQRGSQRKTGCSQGFGGPCL